MIISLTGFMGCGKSSVGKVLSARLGCPFTDLDAAIVERIGCTIPEFFARHGEADFRTLESDVLSATLSRHTLTGHSLPGHTPSPLTPGNEGICPAERRRPFRPC
jgi:shikimate kinase